MSSTIKQAIQALKSRVADAYTAISAKGGTLPATQDSANLPTAIASIPSGGALEGWEFISSVSVSTIGEAVSNLRSLKNLNDDTLTSIFARNDFFSGASYLENANLPNLNSLYGDRLFQSCSSLKEVNLQSLGYIYGIELFKYCGSLEVVNLIGVNTRFDSRNSFVGCANLIDLIIGRNATVNLDLSSWDPTNALDSSSSSLVKTGETFANNLEKLLYNIREHIAKLLNTNAGNKTITFSSNIKAAINADLDTLSAFPSNWTIA